MRYAKRFAGLVLAAGMLMGVGTLSAAERRDFNRVNEHKVAVIRPVKVNRLRKAKVRHNRRVLRRDTRDYRHGWR